MKAPIYFSFNKNGESFIKPKMFEVTIRNQIASPAMGYLVRNQVN